MSPLPSSDLQSFLSLPRTEIKQVAPRTVIFAAGGTRRAAALAGIPLQQMAEFTRPIMLQTCELHFRLGVQNLFMPVARPQMFRETGHYREQLIGWLKWGLAGPESCEFYGRGGWRVRIIITGKMIPDLKEAISTVEMATGKNDGPRLWFIITPDYEECWHWQIEAVRKGAQSRSEMIESLYGERVPPVDLLLSYGKPIFALDIMPPLLYDETQCYWLQKPGYGIEEESLRKIIYDYAYTRKTWLKDKTGRAEQALAHRDVWEKAPILGIGIRFGPFWHPAPFTLPETQKQES